MKQFFKFVFASMLGTFVTLLVFFFIFVGIIASIATLGGDDKPQIEAKSILHLKLDQPIYDRAPNMPFESIDFGSLKANKAFGLNEILKQIENAKNDDRIAGIYLELSDIQASLATISEIREKLESFKSSGKFILSYSEILTQRSYYLASVADKVFMNPEGYLDFKGLSASVMFYKGLLDKLDIEMQVIRGKNNKFKSAVEPLISDKMSEANREQMTKLLSSLWKDMLAKISGSRNIDVNRINTIADSLLTMDINQSVQLGMIDGLLYNDQMMDTLKVRCGIEESKKINLVTLGKYAKSPFKVETKREREKIAIIYAVGEIGSGEGDDKTIGSTRISKALREARKDENIKAVVFRINSPGGSALASDIILREAELLAKEKPLIVSMGDLAASGGYYIACKASRIIANPTTITGSIGVFGVMPNMEKMLKNKLGVSTEFVNTNAHSGYMNPLRGMDSFENLRLQMEVDRIYDAFKKHVSEGRKMSIEKVDSIGQGRVWSGTDALALGLIDELGGLEKAIEIAAREAKLEKYRIVDLPTRKDPFQQLMDDITGKEETEARIKALLGEHFYLYEHTQAVKRFSGVQARMPFGLTIQ